jgi:phage tail-like protein
MVTPVSRKNPYAAFNFLVSVDPPTAKFVAGFMEVSGLDEGNAVIEYREGSDQTGLIGAFPRKQPGLESYPNVMMRRGITGDTTLWKMREDIRLAKEGPTLLPNEKMPNWTVILQNEKHEPVISWTLENAWIAKLSGPSLNAKSNEIAIESVEVVCQRILINIT